MVIPGELQNVCLLLDEPSQFLTSESRDSQATTLAAVKYLFDRSVGSENTSRPHILGLLSSLQPSKAPQTRSRARANASSPKPLPEALFDPTPLTTLFVDGMDEDQVWAQLDLRTKPICDMLEIVLEGDPPEEDVSENGDEDKRLRDSLAALGGDSEVDLEQFLDDFESDDSSLSEDYAEGSEDDAAESTGDDVEEDFGGEGVMTLRDSSSDEDPEDELVSSKRRPRYAKQGKSVLDDGFFDLSAFNAETEQAEARSASKGRLAEEDDSDDDTSVDLFTPIPQGLNFEEDDLENDPGEAFYGDFFEPPPRNASRVKKVLSPAKISNGSGGVRFHQEVRVRTIKPSGKSKPLYEDDEDEDDDDDDDEYYLSNMLDMEIRENDDMEVDPEDGSQDPDEKSDDDTRDSGHRETIERLKDDLFAEEEDVSLEDLTAHEQRMSALREQITELESENVAKKPWTLMGEAGSRARPQNSLLEEDLEFDRVMKAIPVITEEIVQNLEETIKARILENRFDDVVRLRPLEDKPFLPSRLLELQDTKSTQSLAQIYENDYVASAGALAADDRDGKLKKEHDVIEALWEKICGKLDALCNAHFTPKQPKAVISTLSNVSTATLESALPTTKSATTMLAPEEVFSSLSSEPRARSELTPAEKRALRGKERKLKKKQRDTLNTSVDKYAKAKSIGGVKRQKRAALDSVVKHGKGVTVVGKQKKDSVKKHSRKV